MEARVRAELIQQSYSQGKVPPSYSSRPPQERANLLNEAHDPVAEQSEENRHNERPCGTAPTYRSEASPVALEQAIRKDPLAAPALRPVRHLLRHRNRARAHTLSRRNPRHGIGASLPACRHCNLVRRNWTFRPGGFVMRCVLQLLFRRAFFHLL